MIKINFNIIELYGLIPVLCSFLNILLKLFFLRIIKLKYFKSVLLGFLFGLFVTILLEFFLFQKFEFITSYFLLNIFNYFLISFLIFCLFTTGKTSLRVRLLTEIGNAKNGISLDKIYLKYNSEKIVKKRLLRMLSNNQISIKKKKYNAHFSLTLLIALFLDTAKLLLFGKSKCNYF